MLLKELIALNEAGDRKIKVVFVHEGHWDEDFDNGGGASMCPAFEFKESELEKIGLESWDHVYHGEDEDRNTLEDALEDGKIGKKLPDVRVENNDPDLGPEGNEAPEGYEILMMW